MDAPHSTLNETRGHNASQSTAAIPTAMNSAMTRLIRYAPTQKSLDSPRSSTWPQVGHACFSEKKEFQIPGAPQRGQRRSSARPVSAASEARRQRRGASDIAVGL